jgi:carboxymethylproline synthase
MNTALPILNRRERQVEVLQINHRKPQNPVSEEVNYALCEALKRADGDANVSSVVLTGGARRSFSAGGDFAEVAAMTTPESVHAWIGRVIELYTTVLALNKPVVMAVGGYAIGIGMQLALMGDWRVASEDSHLSMWELKMGVACTIGGCILQRCLGRLATTQIIYGCKLIEGREALQLRLIDNLVEPEILLARAIERAEQLASYPAVPFSRTKRSINAPFIEELRYNARISCEAHASSFQNGSADAHMQSILQR